MGYVGKVQVGSTNHSVVSTAYGTCSTAASTAAKVVSLPDYDELIEGSTVHVKFVNSNTATNPTLTVGSTAAKPIYIYGTTYAGKTEDTSWPANSIVSFTYDGTAWRINGTATQKLVNDDKYVLNTGDTMTGPLVMEDANVHIDSNGFTIGVHPDEDSSGNKLYFRDSNNAYVARVQPTFMQDGRVGIGLVGSRVINSELLVNAVSLFVDDNGNRSVVVTSAQAWREALAALCKSGDTVTGNLTFAASNIKDGTPPIGDTAYGITETFTDNEDTVIGQIRPAFLTDGKQGMQFRTRRKVGDEYQDNSIALYQDANGTRTVGLSAAQPWRDALGLGTVALENTVPINKGGSGQTAVNTYSTQSSIIVNMNGFSITSATVKKWGKVVQLQFKAKKTAAQSTESTMQIGTIQTGYIPALTAGFVCTDPSIKYAYSNSGGEVYARGTWAANSEKTFAATYIIP